MYTHGLVVIVSTKKRYGGFAKAVGMRVLTTPHGLGYAATVIVVDDDVDPFNLPQVMWALSTKMNPAGDLIQLPNCRSLRWPRRQYPRHRRQAHHRRHHPGRARPPRPLRHPGPRPPGDGRVDRQDHCDVERPVSTAAPQKENAMHCPTL